MKSKDLPFVISFLRRASSSLVHFSDGAFFFFVLVLFLLFAIVDLLALLCDLDEDAVEAGEEPSLTLLLLRVDLRVEDVIWLPSSATPSSIDGIFLSLSTLLLGWVGKWRILSCKMVMIVCWEWRSVRCGADMII